VGVTLTGNDYISKVKITETDTYGLATTNENTSPSNKYVKPYTPAAPTVENPQNTSVDVTVNSHAGESTAVEYAIYEVSSNKYVQTNGTLGATAVWKTLGTGAGQWGNTSGVSGKVAVTGLVSPVASYSFKTKSRNTSDGAHAASSESALSAIAAINNTSPTIVITSATQQGNNNYRCYARSVLYNNMDNQLFYNLVVLCDKNIFDGIVCCDSQAIRILH